MSSRTSSAGPGVRLRPCSSREIHRRLDEVAEALERVGRSSEPAGLRVLAPADLLRILAPIVSRN